MTFGFAAAVQAQTYTGVDLYTMNAPPGINPQSLSDLQSAATSEGQVASFGITVGIGSSINQGILWSLGGTVINLNPTNLTGFSQSVAQGIGGNQEVGYGGGSATGLNSINDNYHALLWHNTANSAVDLNPTNLTGFTISRAFATDGAHQVGYGVGSDTFSHALLWNGAANSAVNLQPTTLGSQYYASFARGVSGNQQVGDMYGQAEPAAVLWTGTAASEVNLNPISNGAYTYNSGTVAFGVGGGQEVGYGDFSQGGPYSHALLWRGTAASYVDLNPAGYSNTTAVATNGSIQAGYSSAYIGNAPEPTPYAMMWSGTAASAVSLQPLLPSYLTASVANSIDAAGDVFGVAYDTSGAMHSVEWIAPPHIATGTASGGSNQSVVAAGRSPTAGNVQVVFSTTSGGTLTNTNSLLTPSGLGSNIGTVNFELPTSDGLAQTWDLVYTGTFTGSATVTFHYDLSDLSPSIDPTDLQIEHYTNGQWVSLSGIVNPIADTITVSTNSFSPFVLAALPEPGSLMILAGGGLLLLRRRQRA
jgi:hypothetical protein